MKIYRPDNLGVMYRSLHFARRDTLAIGMLAFFRLDRGEPADLLPEPELWAAAAQALGDAPLDEGMPKPAAEYKVYGKAHAPAGSVVGQGIPVGVKLGGLSKQALLTAEQKFMTEPFWGLAPSAPQRQSLLGAFDARWLKNTWPHLPDDTRLEYFMSAPADQRFPAFLQGGEALELRNLHPSQPVLAGRLPSVRARCFVNRRIAGGKEEFSEAQARLETVWLLPEMERGIALFRAQAACADDDASDVLHVMAEWESLGAAPLPFAHYHDLFAQKRTGAALPAAQAASAPPQPAAAAPQTPAAPAVPVAAVAALAAPDFSAAYAELGKLEQQTQSLMQKHGLTEADIAPYLQPEPESPALSLDEVHKQVDALNKETQALMSKHNITQDDIAPLLQPEPEPEQATLKDMKTMLRDMNQDTQGLMQKHGLTDQDVQALLQKANPEAEPWQGMASLTTEIEALPEAMPQLPAAAALAAAPAAVGAPPPTPETPAAARQLTREEVVARHAAKQSLNGYDLSGVDLSKLDLSGADFSGCLLAGAVFAGSKLRGAKFELALLQKADFSDADLTQATLKQASASEGKFAKAVLQGAQLAHGDFTGADFSEAQLTGGANLAGARFDGARLGKVRANGCAAQQASFGGADLSGADFSQANLSQASFLQGKLAATDFGGAQCLDADFHGAQADQAKFRAANLSASRAGLEARFAQADFSDAILERANWDGVILSGAIFTRANLDHADFSNAKAEAANFQRASAKGAIFGRTDLSRADLSGINLFKGSLRKAAITGALLRQANLYGVDFDGTRPTVAMLEGSNIDNTLLAVRPPAV
jgi:uncharacterized protein YjbI with pentapeptide repeats